MAFVLSSFIPHPTFFSLPEHAVLKFSFLGYRNVRRRSGRPSRPSDVACVHSRGHSFDPIFMTLCQNVYLFKIQAKFKTGLCRVKT